MTTIYPKSLYIGPAGARATQVEPTSYAPTGLSQLPVEQPPQLVNYNNTSSFVTSERAEAMQRMGMISPLVAPVMPGKTDMLEMLKDGQLSAVEASTMKRASMTDKLALLESWGMKPKHTNKDPNGVDELFNHVVDSMQRGPGVEKGHQFAGSKFKIEVKRGPNGELTVGFKRKKPKFGFFKKLFKKVLGFVTKPLSIVNPISKILSKVGIPTFETIGKKLLGGFTQK